MNEHMKKAKQISMTETLAITAGCIYLWILKLASFYHACRYLLATVIALGVSVVILMIIIDYSHSEFIFLFLAWSFTHMFYLALYEVNRIGE